MSPVFLVCLAKKEQKQERKEPGDDDCFYFDKENRSSWSICHAYIYTYICVYIYRAFFGGLYLDEFSPAVTLMDFQCLSL